MQPLEVQLDEVLPGDTVKCQLERQFLAGDSFLDDRVVDVTQKVAALSAVDCADVISQLLTYFDAYVSQIKAKVKCMREIVIFSVLCIDIFLYCIFLRSSVLL